METKLMERKIVEVEEKLEKAETEIAKNSFAWMLAGVAKRNFIGMIVVLFLWFATIAGFVWYLAQYDFSGTVEVDAKEGLAVYQDGKGNTINNGESDGYQKTNP